MPVTIYNYHASPCIIHIPYLALLLYFYHNKKKYIGFNATELVHNFNTINYWCRCINEFAGFYHKIANEELSQNLCLKLDNTYTEYIGYGYNLCNPENINKTKEYDVLFKLKTEHQDLEKFFTNFANIYSLDEPIESKYPTLIFNYIIDADDPLYKYFEIEEKNATFHYSVDDKFDNKSQNTYKNLEYFKELKQEFLSEICGVVDEKSYKVPQKYLPVVIAEMFTTKDITLKSFNISLFSNRKKYKNINSIKIFPDDNYYGVELVNEDIFDIDIVANIKKFIKNSNTKAKIMNKDINCKIYQGHFTDKELACLKYIQAQIKQNIFEIDCDNMFEFIYNNYTNMLKSDVRKLVDKSITDVEAKLKKYNFDIKIKRCRKRNIIYINKDVKGIIENFILIKRTKKNTKK